ncbi:hypothetical protein Tcan_07441 [Toxocara canis]|uniref:Ig-like domain-containing protein n=1 Tax=Toxocara canis TaxID=6265 RepID=A0A0B2W1M9_TOXCA|nr:hypothetical protein Tcan_07441 [Toxocara canis]
MKLQSSIITASPFIISPYKIPSEGSFYSIPQEGQTVTFNCASSTSTKALFWILPNGTRVDVDAESESALVNLNISQNQLVIPEVHKGMDGQYVCVLEGAQRQIFFIPYVVSQTDFIQTFLISTCITLGFAFVCVLVLLLDRYSRLRCLSRHRRARTARQSLNTVRKKRITMEAIAEESYNAIGEGDLRSA